MKFTATKERGKLREEFVYKYASEIQELIIDRNNEKIKSFVEGVVKKELEYNCKTNWIDIFTFLKNTFNKLFNY